MRGLPAAFALALATAAACSVPLNGTSDQGGPPPVDASIAEVDATPRDDGSHDAPRADADAAWAEAEASAEGGACDDGACAPTVLASGQSQPLSIAVDAQHVFWVNAGASDGTGSVMRSDLDGSDGVALASGRNHPFGIALDDTSVYWSEEGSMAASFTDGVLYRLGKDGSCAKAPCPPPILGGQYVPLGIAVDATSIYFARAGDGTIWRWGKDGSAGAQLSAGETSPLFVAVSPSAVFWTDEGSSASGFADGRVREAPFDGGVVSIASAQTLAYGIALDDAGVYWATLYGGTIGAVSQGGGDAGAIVRGLSQPTSVAVSDGWIYFAVQGPMGSEAQGTIEAVRIDGTCPGTPCPRVLAAGRGAPWGIAVDASYVYWTEPGPGNVARVAR